MGLVSRFDKLADQMKRHEQSEIEMDLAMPPANIEHWLVRVRIAANQAEVLSIVEQFKRLFWSDEQRALMSRSYIRRLDVLAEDSIVRTSDHGQNL